MAKKIIFSLVILLFCVSNAFAIRIGSWVRQERVFPVRSSERVSSVNSPNVLYEKAYQSTNRDYVIGSLRKLVSQYPQDPQSIIAQLEIAKHFYISGDYLRASEEFSKFLNTYGKNAFVEEAFYYLALSYAALSDKQNANLCFDKIIFEIGSTSKFYVLACMGKGDMYFKLGNLDETNKYYKKAQDVVKDNKVKSSLYYKIVQLRKKQGRWDEANQYFYKLVTEFHLSNEVLLVNKTNRDFNSGEFSVQMGLFSSQTNAYRLNERLASKGYDSFVLPPSVGNEKTFYRVMVGHFKDKDEAVKVLIQLKIKEKMQGKIVP